MADKEILDAAFKAFKKRLKIYQNDASSSSAPAAHLSKGAPQITAIEPPNQWPQEVWDELVAKGRLRKAGSRTYELNK